METAILFLLMTVVALAIIFISRNNDTYRIRRYFLDKKWHLYNYLPSYDGMLFNPAYWHLWTIPDWVEYAETKYMQEVKND